jgi:hypothetical protein
MSILQPSWSHIHEFILPGCAERPPRSLPRVVRLLMAFTMPLNLAMLPVFECPRRPDQNCREDYDQRMRAASAPWATPDQAAGDANTGWTFGAWFIGPEGQTLAQIPSSAQKSASREFVLVPNVPIARR